MNYAFLDLDDALVDSLWTTDVDSAFFAVLVRK